MFTDACLIHSIHKKTPKQSCTYPEPEVYRTKQPRSSTSDSKSLSFVVLAKEKKFKIHYPPSSVHQPAIADMLTGVYSYKMTEIAQKSPIDRLSPSPIDSPNHPTLLCFKVFLDKLLPKPELFDYVISWQISGLNQHCLSSI